MNWNFGLFWLVVIWGVIVGALTLLAFIQERGSVSPVLASSRLVRSRCLRLECSDMPKITVTGIVLGILAALFIGNVEARDVGQWENSDPAIHEWYKTLERPDAPGSICCTEADAYFADEVHVRDGKTYAKITDDRPDAPLGRPHIPPGTEFEVPNEKLKWDRGNPTGHNVLFVSVSGFTWCFVMGAGI